MPDVHSYFDTLGLTQKNTPSNSDIEFKKIVDAVAASVKEQDIQALWGAVITGAFANETENENNYDTIFDDICSRVQRVLDDSSIDPIPPTVTEDCEEVGEVVVSEEDVDWNRMSIEERAIQSVQQLIEAKEESEINEEHSDEVLEALLVVTAADNERVRVCSNFIHEVLGILSSHPSIMLQLSPAFVRFSEEITKYEGIIREQFDYDPSIEAMIDDTINDLK